jgi:hypothetical protein
MKTTIQNIAGLAISAILLPTLASIAIIGYVAGIVFIGLQTGFALAEMTPPFTSKLLKASK